MRQQLHMRPQLGPIRFCHIGRRRVDTGQDRLGCLVASSRMSGDWFCAVQRLGEVHDVVQRREILRDCRPGSSWPLPRRSWRRSARHRWSGTACGVASIRTPSWDSSSPIAAAFRAWSLGLVSLVMESYRSYSARSFQFFCGAADEGAAACPNIRAGTGPSIPVNASANKNFDD